MLKSFLLIPLALALFTGCSISGSLSGKGGNFASNPGGSPIIFKVIELDTITLTLSEGGAAIINVALDNIYSTDTTISISFLDPNGRFQAIPSQMTIPSGQVSSSITLQTQENSAYNGSQSFTLNISSPDSDTAADPLYDELIINLNDNDSMPTVEFSLASQNINENAVSATVTLNLSAASGLNTTVPISVNPSSTATQGVGQDFTLSATSVVIPAGSTSSSFTVNINNDAILEVPNEVIEFTLGSITNGTAGTQNTQNLTIVDDEIFTVTVASTYPLNNKWSDYVKNNNGGTSEFDQPDTSCVGNETGGYSACIHGGEKRKVTVTGYSSCTGLTISDSLGVFDWICRVDSGVATFHTVGLKLTAGLGDLINSDRTWKNNSVTVKLNGNTIANSLSSAWWNNNLVAPPAHTGNPAVISSGTNSSGDIIVINSNLSHSGFNINLDKISIVVLPGFTLSFGGGTGCVWATGENKDGGFEENCAFAAGNQKFLWVEGNINGSTGFGNLDMGVLFTNVKFSRINRINQRLGDDTGLGMVSSSNNKITNVKFENFGSYSNLYFEGSTDNLAIDVQVAQSYHGVNLNSGSHRNTFINVKSFNTKDSTNNIELDTSNNNTFVNVLSASSGNAGFHIKNSSSRTTLSHYFSANESDESIWAGDDYISINQAVIVNNGDNWSGIHANGNSVILSQVVVAHGHDDGIEVNGSNGFFTNNILIGNNSIQNCRSGNGTSGFTNSCTNSGTSNAVFNVGAHISLASSFVGKIIQDDSMNTSDTLGLRAYSQTLIDWLLFDNPFRVWSQDGSTFPNLDQTDTCISGNCRIWDWRLLSTDTVIRNKSGNGSSDNEAFVAGSTCPSAVNGNKAITDQNSTPRTFLVNATEIMNDGYGNENGLCESNEACLYSPNFGYYQGEGDYKAAGTCNFQNGTVSNVMMYAYPTNGI